MEPSFNINNCSVSGGGIIITNKGGIKVKDTFYLATKKGKNSVPFRTEDEAVKYVVRRNGWKVKNAYFGEGL